MASVHRDVVVLINKQQRREVTFRVHFEQVGEDVPDIAFLRAAYRYVFDNNASDEVVRSRVRFAPSTAFQLFADEHGDYHESPELADFMRFGRAFIDY